MPTPLFRRFDWNKMEREICPTDVSTFDMTNKYFLKESLFRSDSTNNKQCSI